MAGYSIGWWDKLTLNVMGDSSHIIMQSRQNGRCCEKFRTWSNGELGDDSMYRKELNRTDIGRINISSLTLGLLETGPHLLLSKL